tara:strand:+ start:15451 stop:15834 length:384 start_codon:yes stop_codon:yes gene_type:complete
MLQVTIAGRLGRDAEHKTTQSGTDLCSFPVAADVGFGDKKQTYWVDVTRWGKGAQGLAGILRKGSAVTVCGELTTREHNGKTYLQCRADQVTIQGIPQGGSSGESQGAPAGGNSKFATDELDDDIPF